MSDKSDVSKVKVSVRLDRPIYIHLKMITEKLGWSFSEVIRYLLSVSYTVLRPDVSVNSEKLIKYIKKETRNGDIHTWKIIRYIVPRVIEQIERIEKKS